MTEPLTPTCVATPPLTIPALLAAQTLLGGAGLQIGWLLVRTGGMYTGTAWRESGCC